jgi:hypothetical protein
MKNLVSDTAQKCTSCGQHRSTLTIEYWYGACNILNNGERLCDKCKEDRIAWYEANLEITA